MGNYNLNSIMARINHIDVQEKMVQNQDVSLFIYIVYLLTFMFDFNPVVGKIILNSTNTYK